MVGGLWGLRRGRRSIHLETCRKTRRKDCPMNAIAKAIYSGTLISDLEASAERMLRHNSIRCECGHALGEHSHEGKHCPNPLPVGPLDREGTFKELRCEASVNECKCDKPVVAGKRMCEEHAQ